MKHIYEYFVNGFQVHSEVELPCDSRIVPIDSLTSNLNIYYGGPDCTNFDQIHWVGQRSWSRCYDVGNGMLLCALGDFKMHITIDGSAITLYYNLECPKAVALAAACAANLGMAACSLLRGKLALHCASVEIDGHLIGIMAPPETGKTTILWGLLDRGALFSSDDMTPVSIASSSAIVEPSISQYAKLSREALSIRRKDTSGYTETYPQSEEFWVPIPSDQRVITPDVLDALFILDPTPYLSTTSRVMFRRVKGAAALPLLQNNMQGLWTVTNMINGYEFTRKCIGLSQHVPIFFLQYHRSYESLPYLLNLISELSVKK